MSKEILSKFFDTLFSYPKAMISVLNDLDARIVSEEGEEVLRDKNKMKKVDEAISEHNKNPKSDSDRIIIQF